MRVKGTKGEHMGTSDSRAALGGSARSLMPGFCPQDSGGLCSSSSWAVSQWAPAWLLSYRQNKGVGLAYPALAQLPLPSSTAPLPRPVGCN